MQKTLLFAVVLLCVSFSPAQETAGSLIQKGEQAYNEEHYKTAMVAFLQGVAIAQKENNTVPLLKAYNHISAIYSLSGEYASALHYTKESLSLYKKSNDYRNMALKAEGAAILYMRQKNYTQSLTLYKEAHTYAKQAGETLHAADCLSGCGRVSQKQKEYAAALDYFLQAAGTYDTYNQVAKKGLVLSYIGSVYNSMGNYEKSIEAYKEALGYFDSLQDYKSVAVTLNDLGRTFARTGDYNESLELHKQAYIDAAAIKFEKAVAEACRGLSDAYEHLGHYPDAIRYRKLYEQKADSIDQKKQLRDEARLRLKHEAQAAWKEVEMMAAQKRLKDTAEEKKGLEAYNFYGLIGCSTSVAILIFTVVYFLADRKKMRRKHKKEIAKLSRAQKEQEQKLQMVKNVHKDLHDKLSEISKFNDEISQRAVAGHKNGHKKAINGNSYNTAHLPETVTKTFIETDNETPQSLAGSLRDFTTQYISSSRLELVFSVEEGMPHITVSKEIKKVLTAILKEALSNVMVHAKATRLFIGIAATKGGMEVTVSDDGPGYRGSYFSGSFLKIMSKLKTMGGETSIQAIPGYGTTIKILVPYSEEKIN